MLCCFSPSWADPKAAYENQAIPPNDMAAYPGVRKNHRAQWAHPVGATRQHTEYAQENVMDVVSVTVPVGVSGGETIHVLHPDQSGRVIEAVVPSGLKAGTKFYVQAPPQVATTLPGTSASVISPLAEPALNSGPWHNTPSTAPLAPSAPPMPPLSVETDPWSPAVTAVPIPPPASRAPSLSSSIPPFSQAFDSGFPARYTQMNAATALPVSPLMSPISQNNNIGQMRLVKVVVPPGTEPGSTIHVQVPGENRLVAARVPPHCTEFHVEYDPRETPTSAVMESPVAQQLSWPPPPPTPDTKLLLVRVPRGTPAGSRLHVQVPNEHGRLVEAKVPPNVSEFYVSYVPAAGPTIDSRPTTNSNGRGWESSVFPFAGGIATGVAGGLVYDHFAHHHTSRR